jgi:mRNA-degrading endonuclease RelE of RelBE toxin-antitoxin system
MSDPERRKLELTRKAQRDIRRLDRQDQLQIRKGLENLVGDAQNLDVKHVSGRPPWLRLRIGELSVLYRPEDTPAGPTWNVARVVHRQELDRAVSTLP